MKKEYKWARIVDEKEYSYKIDINDFKKTVDTNRNIVHSGSMVSLFSKYKIGQPVEQKIIEVLELANTINDTEVYKDSEGFAIRGWETYDAVILKTDSGYIRGTRADAIYKRFLLYKKMIGAKK